MLASALAISLTGDRPVTAPRLADAAAGQYKIDIRQTVLDALGLVFHATSVQQHRGFRRPPDLSRPHDAGGWYSGDRFGCLRRVTLDEFSHLVETSGVLLDEFPVVPALGEHDVQNSVRERAVASWPHRKKEVG